MTYSIVGQQWWNLCSLILLLNSQAYSSVEFESLWFCLGNIALCLFSSSRFFCPFTLFAHITRWGGKWESIGERGSSKCVPIHRLTSRDQYWAESKLFFHTILLHLFLHYFAGPVLPDQIKSALFPILCPFLSKTAHLCFLSNRLKTTASHQPS